MKYFVLLLLIASYTMALPHQYPIIGIFTLPSEGDQPKEEQYNPSSLKVTNYSYIAASYVKYIQMSGAQVVPLFAFSNTTALQKILTQINGVLFTGGGTSIDINNKWTKSADYIVKYAISQNAKGNVFPVWGTCLGWQLLAYLTSGYDSKCLSPVRGESGVRNTVSIKSQNYLYNGISPALKDKLQNGQGIVYFNHVYAVSTAYFQGSTKLKSFWKLISSTKSSYSQEFVSTAEGIQYPFFGVQFHPQKNLYEWKVSADRSASGAQIAQILSNKFVEKARQNGNRFASDGDFRKAVIYNYKTQSTNMSFIEIYVFTQIQSELNTDLKELKHLSIQ